MLKPQANSTRDLINLDGLWQFALIPNDEGNDQSWTKPVPKGLEAPVPASYNDIFVDRKVHDHVGWVRYQREVTVPRGWSGEKFFIRVEAATHHGRVYVNDKFVTEHIGGYTPFDAEITELINPGETFLLTIAVSNELDNTTIPPGKIEVSANGGRKQSYHHDFYNYSGLARSVWLYSTSQQYVDDVTLVTDVQGTTGLVKYIVKTGGAVSDGSVKVLVKDQYGTVVGEASGTQGVVHIQDVNLWQPGQAYLYDFQAMIEGSNGKITDT